MSAPVAFTTPDFKSPLDVEATIAAVPETATCKGMFFTDVAAHATRANRSLPSELEDLVNQRYLAFRDYPLRLHMKMTALLAPCLLPDQPLREGLRRLGWLAFPAFAHSLVGKVTLGLLGTDPARILDVAPRSISLSLSPGQARSTPLSSTSYEVELKEVYGYPDCYYVGVLEGPLLYLKQTPTVVSHMYSNHHGVYRISW